MDNITKTAIGLLIPFLGTVAGAGMVFFINGAIKSFVQKLLLGFASGVMIAASVWSLLMPAIDMASEQGKVVWLPAAIGFLSGNFFLLLLDISFTLHRLKILCAMLAQRTNKIFRQIISFMHISAF